MYIRKFVVFCFVATPLLLIEACNNNEGDNAHKTSLSRPKIQNVVTPLKKSFKHALNFQKPIPQVFNDAPPPASKEELANLLIGTPFEASVNNNSALQQEENLPAFEPSQFPEDFSNSNDDNSKHTNTHDTLPPASKKELANLLIGTPFENNLNNSSIAQQEGNLPTFESAVQEFYASKK
jgi:hypothetical protein